MCFRAAVDEQRDDRPQVRVDRKEQAIVFAAVAEPLENPHSGKWIHSQPAVLGRNRQALDAKLTAFSPSVVIENSSAVVLDHVIIELLAGETADSIQ